MGRRRFLAFATSALLLACGGRSERESNGAAPNQAAEPQPSPSSPAQTREPQPTPARPTLTQEPRPTARPTQTPGPEQIRLQYENGSTTKVEQLIGDFDNQTKQATQNLSGSRYGVHGTDLGNSFEHNGTVYFVFGDMNAPFAPDPIAFSESTDPNGPLLLDFLTDAQGGLLPVRPPGIEMGPFEVNTAGLSLDGSLYVVVRTDHTDALDRHRSVLTRFDEQSRSFTAVRDISRLPGGRFIQMTLRHAPEGLVGLPSTGPQVLMFGAGEAKKSNAYLASIPASSFASGDGTLYFAGLAGAMPRWSDNEADAAPLFDHPVLSEISVIEAEQLGLWLMLYTNGQIPPIGVVLRYAVRPWGPWSSPQVVFNARRDRSSGAFIHDAGEQPDDGLGGPTAGASHDIATTQGGPYAPYLIERFTQVEADRLTLHFLLSTWNPYVVVRMRSTLSIQRS